MATKIGTSAADVINGTTDTDWLFGRGGGDLIHGGDGADALWGEGDGDVLWGDAGSDFLSGGTGNDQLGGGGVNNILHGEDGDDTLLYSPGNIRLVPGTDYGGQWMEGGRGYDTLRLASDAFFTGDGGSRIPARLYMTSGEAATFLYFTNPNGLWVPGGAFTGIERVELRTASDVFLTSGPEGHAMLVVGSPDDDRFELRGRPADIAGGAGALRIEGGGGSDIFDLQAGSVSIVLNPGEADEVTVSSLSDGVKRVHGFGQGDRLAIVSQADPVEMREVGGRTFISSTLEGVAGSIVIDATGLVRDENTFTFGPGSVARGAPPAWPRTAMPDAPPPRDLRGTPEGETIDGGSERERIFAGGGNDHVRGGNGDDLVYGGGGNDRLLGEQGYDRIFAGAGNDWVEFGPDGGDAHGGSGDDVLIFDPGAVNVNLARASGRIDGGDGFDVLRVTNRAFASWGDEPVGPAVMSVHLAGAGSSNLNEPTVSIGAYSDDGITGARLRFFSIERIEVATSRTVHYTADEGSSLPSMHFVSGTGNDTIFSGAIDEVLDGGRGDDFFRFGGGNDTFISRMGDADTFEVGFHDGTVRIQGFNGAGVAGGDRLTINGPATVTRSQGATVFDWSDGQAIVNAVGLVEGVDYFFL
ncbi:calcium-binding protein [Arenibaculum pallidiluteum]|uniref:calcium-binding protein n=1 Tax=Arenibaculum pallidiluteum TaxID=2812559 RepID=UPI001A974AEF|nr:calcium-binding protein [Arenibaculum pallidiluteum]